MVRGFYSAASGVFSQQKVFNTTANNIANASTAGYKNQVTVQSSFGDHLVNRLGGESGQLENRVGPGSFITVNPELKTDFSQGAIQETGRSVDLAIEGRGFFLVENSSGEEVLTRNGQFRIDEEGHLSLQGVGKVLGDNRQPIKISKDTFQVDAGGTISVDGKNAGKLFIAGGADEDQLTSRDNGIFTRDGAIQQEDEKVYSLIQGALEKSNMDISAEMSRIIAGQNRYNSCSQVLKIYDKINEIAANQIGRLG